MPYPPYGPVLPAQLPSVSPQVCTRARSQLFRVLAERANGAPAANGRSTRSRRSVTNHSSSAGGRFRGSPSLVRKGLARHRPAPLFVERGCGGARGFGRHGFRTAATPGSITLSPLAGGCRHLSFFGRREFDPGPSRLRQSDRDRLFGVAHAVFSLANVL